MNPVTKIFCAFPIFAPSKNLFDRNKDSILSFIDYLKVNDYYLNGSKGFLLDISYGGWVKEQGWFDDLRDTIKENIPNAKVYQFDKNYGKAKVVNELAFDYSKDNPTTNFLFTCDSDMCFEISQPHMFGRLVLAANVMQQKSNEIFGNPKVFGMVALNQSEACCHWFPENKPEGYTGLNRGIIYDSKGENNLSMKEELVWPQDGAGIAGGSIFCNFVLFKQNGGYRNFNTQYAGDDGLWLRDVQQMGGSVCVIKSLSMRHPTPTDDPEYRKWKDECMKFAFDEYDQNKYDNNMKEFENMVNKNG